ncbi:MAG: hypothetical protein IAE91_00290, partial [Ignavibacteriaceae bacterium]|nr:hypothetical protein [Ignavibacteriaceae bacterium]
MLKITLFVFFVSTFLFSQWENAIKYDTTSLRSVVVLNDSSAVVVGTNGAVFKSHNYLKTWQIKSFDLTKNFQKLIKINENKLFLYDNSGNLFHSNTGGDSWELLYNFSLLRIKYLHFRNDLVGLAIITTLTGGNAKIFKTTNSGISWSEFSILPAQSIKEHTSLKFTDDNTGFLTAITLSNTGILYKTINGGITWDSISTFAKPIYDVFFPDSTTGYVSGTGVFKTDNGGAFFYTTMFESSQVRSIKGISKDTLFVLTQNGKVRRTNNGGADWTTPLPSGTLSGNLTDFDISASFNSIIASSYTDSIFYTINGGNSYQNMNFPILNLSFLRAIDDSSCFAIDKQKLIFLSTDRGINWQISRFSSNVSLPNSIISDLFILNDTSFFAVSDKSEFFRSSNLLYGWVRVVNNHLSYVPNTLVFLNGKYGIQGGIRYNQSYFAITTDAGLNWNFNTSIFNNKMIKIQSTTDLTCFLTTDGNIFKSFDSVKTRISITPQGYSNFTNSYFLDSLTGFVLSNHYIFRTTNGGNSWQKYNHPRAVELNSICFFDSLNGFGTNDNGIFHTTNGGLDWVQETQGQNLASSISFSNPDLGWAIMRLGTNPNGKSLIYKRDTGGTTSIFENNNVTPGSFTVFQNYPNPFNPTTRISYNLYEAGFVSVRIHNLLGQEVKFFEKSYK